MQKKWKKPAALLLALVMVFTLAACGGGDGGGSTDDVMKTAQEALSKVESMSYEMNMTMNMSAGGQSIESETVGKIQYISDPLTMSMNMNMDMGVQGSAEIQMYAEQSGDEVVMYMTPDGTNWGKQTLLDAEQLEQYNAQDSMNLYLGSINSFKEAGTEQVNGKDAVKYEGTISNDELSEVMETAGTADSLTQLGITEDQISEMYADLGDLPVQVWIESESGLPVKYEMDMTDMMQKLMDKVVETMGEDAAGMTITIDKVFVSMVLSDFDAVGEIVIPEEAKNAQEMNLI